MPTVVRSRTSFLFSRRRVRMAARAAAQRFAERKETMVQTCWTAMQSASEGSRPRSVRISLVLARPSLYLARGQEWEDHTAPPHGKPPRESAPTSRDCEHKQAGTSSYNDDDFNSDHGGHHLLLTHYVPGACLRTWHVLTQSSQQSWGEDRHFPTVQKMDLRHRQVGNLSTGTQLVSARVKIWTQAVRLRSLPS